jgi:hypothetical protein
VLYGARDWDEHTIEVAYRGLLPSRRGVLVGSVTVTGCHHADECLIAGTPKPHGGMWVPDRWCSPWAQPDCFHWTLADPEPLDVPIPMKGRQGLWRLPDDVEVPA